MNEEMQKTIESFRKNLVNKISSKQTGLPLEFDLHGPGGNALAINGRALNTLKDSGNEDLIPAFREDADLFNNNYEHLLQKCKEWFIIIDAEDYEEEEEDYDF